jgi:prepilin-type processing-associated H-X9-DG protein
MKLPVHPEDIGQLLLFWEAEGQAEPPRGPTLVPSPSGFVLRMTKPQDWKTLMTNMAGPGLQEARHEGQTYYRAGANGPSTPAFFMPDDRTIVWAEEVALRELITDRNTPATRHPWDLAWKKVARGQIMVALDTRWLRRRLAAGPGQAPGGMVKLETFAPLYEKAQSYAASLGATDQSVAIDLVAAVGSPENAKPVAETMQAIVTLGKNALEGLRRDADRQPRAEAAEWAIQTAGSALDKARIETTEGFVRLHAESPVDLAEGIRLMVPAVTSARAAARRAMSVNNLKQIGLALHNFLSANNHFPASANGDKGQFPYSWRVAILPYIEQQGLYNEYRFDEPWDGPNNRKLIDKMPAIYTYPGPDGTPSSRSHTSYFVFNGPQTIGGTAGGAQIQQITDGTSNTILAVEARRDVPWTKPEDLPFDPNNAVPDLGGFTPDGFNALFADGSVRYIKKSINPRILKYLITPNGGEVISSDQY